MTIECDRCANIYVAPDKASLTERVAALREAGWEIGEAKICYQCVAAARPPLATSGVEFELDYGLAPCGQALPLLAEGRVAAARQQIRFWLPDETCADLRRRVLRLWQEGRIAVQDGDGDRARWWTIAPGQQEWPVGSAEEACAVLDAWIEAWPGDAPAAGAEDKDALIAALRDQVDREAREVERLQSEVARLRALLA